MIKHVVSALALSGLLIGSTAFAADTAAPAGQTPAPAATTSSATTGAHHSTVHKRADVHKTAAKKAAKSDVKATGKTEQSSQAPSAPVSGGTPAKSN